MSVISVSDKAFMRRALRLAARARGLTSPNPLVGSLLVRDGAIIDEDYHRKAGEPHAEALVLKKAGDKARGATLYVTLEPCCHVDKRTPPCTKALIASGIRKVFVAMKDPNPKVSGKGIEELRNHGIEVINGVCEEEALKLNEAYVKYITTGVPFVTLKVAMTLDGKIATPEGQSKWITGEEARRLVHRMRSRVDAVMTAIGTVMADNPELTVRIRRLKGQGARNPRRVVIDPHLETPLDYRIFDVPPETIVVTRKSGKPGVRSEESEEKRRSLIDGEVRLIEYEGERVDLKWLMKRLGERGITSVMIEGGSSLNAYALQDGIVDKVAFFIAPKIIGGRESLPAVGGKTFRELDDAITLKDARIRKVGQDFLIEGYVATRR